MKKKKKKKKKKPFKIKLNVSFKKKLDFMLLLKKKFVPICMLSDFFTFIKKLKISFQLTSIFHKYNNFGIDNVLPSDFEDYHNSVENLLTKINKLDLLPKLTKTISQ